MNASKLAAAGSGVKNLAVGTAVMLAAVAAVYVVYKIYRGVGAGIEVVKKGAAAVTDATGFTKGGSLDAKNHEVLLAERARLESQIQAQRDMGLGGTVIDELEARIDEINEQLGALAR